MGGGGQKQQVGERSLNGHFSFPALQALLSRVTGSFVTQMRTLSRVKETLSGIGINQTLGQQVQARTGTYGHPVSEGRH